MYKLFSDGNFLGYAEELNYIKKSSNGCFVPTDKEDAQGVAFKSVAYSFDAGKLNGCPKTVISEAGIDEINERITAARADLDYVMMMTDTAIPVDETVIKEVSE